MKTLTKRAQLDQDIALLENRQAAELEALKQHFGAFQHSLNPLNLIKNTFKEVAAHTTASGILGGAVSIAGDYLATKILPGKGPLKNIGSAILRFFGRKILPSTS